MDFNEYAKNGGKQKSAGESLDKSVENLISSIASKFDGKSQNELLKAIYEQAKKGKENGTLTNGEIDNFVAMLTPVLDDKKRKILFKVAEEIKKI